MVLPQSPGDFPPAMSAQKKFPPPVTPSKDSTPSPRFFISTTSIFSCATGSGSATSAIWRLAALLGLIYTGCRVAGRAIRAPLRQFHRAQNRFRRDGRRTGSPSARNCIPWPGHLAACVVNIGMCFIWPTLEALVSESAPAGVPRAVGIYNITWAVTNASAFFIGGTLIVKFGFKSIFYLPFAMMLAQFALVFWLQNHASNPRAETAGKNCRAPPDPNRPSPARAKTFLRMAWLANPFAYIAINTLIAVTARPRREIPVSPMPRGICLVAVVFRPARRSSCSGAGQTGITASAGWPAAFALLIFVRGNSGVANLAVLMIAQIFFGGAIGLIYYSSLFYSMDGGDTKSEHGGIHEAAIGAGQLHRPGDRRGGAAISAAIQNSGAIAVSVLLLCGFGGLVTNLEDDSCPNHIIFPPNATFMLRECYNWVTDSDERNQKFPITTL
jgi:hypothetical protein